MRIGLVACAKTKTPYAAPARELYVSALFKKASAYAERAYDRWYILSAKHGVVEPDRILAPYDLTLKDLTPDDRAEWARQVGLDLRRRHPDGRGEYHAWYLHAGVLYRQHLRYRLSGAVEAPLAGYAIGEQLHWYRVRNAIPPVPARLKA